MTLKDVFSGKKIVVTGACGTIGDELVGQLLGFDVEKIVCLDNNESELFFLQEKYRKDPRVKCYIIDISDFDSLKSRMQNADIVLHAAALKHVGLCEDSPIQAVRTNILGTHNVVEAAVANGVGKVIFTSSDKAVNPTSVMGTSKLMGERMVTAANEKYGHSGTVFASTRFGNVLGSRGSVIPVFRRQIMNGGPITLTDSRMTRFVMTLKEAASLVLGSVEFASGGEVFVTKMPVARIEDIALTMVEHAQKDKPIEITTIGAKAGEKLYEELMNEEEVRRSFEMDNFFVIIPPFVSRDMSRYAYLDGKKNPEHAYKSTLVPSMSKSELKEYLSKNSLL